MYQIISTFKVKAKVMSGNLKQATLKKLASHDV